MRFFLTGLFTSQSSAEYAGLISRVDRRRFASILVMVIESVVNLGSETDKKIKRNQMHDRAKIKTMPNFKKSPCVLAILLFTK